MSVTTVKHEAKPVPGVMGWQAVCSCGWYTMPTALGKALKRAESHNEKAGANDE